MNAEMISVIIPSWNGIRLLPACLTSLRAQTDPLAEILVVDNASVDGTSDLVRIEFPEAHVTVLPRNQGFSAAVNAGIRMAEGGLIALLNQDVVVGPDWLAALREAAESHPEAGAIACKIMLHDRPDHFHSAGDFFGHEGVPINRGVWELDVGQYDTPQQVFAACGGAAAYRRALFDQIGAFDESFFMYLEDVDLAWRQQLAGWRTWYAPSAVAYHHLSASGGGATASYYTGRNTVYVIAKNIPGVLLRRYGKLMAAAQGRILADALRSWRGEAARARMRGVLVGLMTWPRMLGARRRIQRSRRVPLEYLDNLLGQIDCAPEAQ